MSENKNSPRVIAISSGKGGVGKSFFSVHLAARAVEKGQRVLLLDADFGLANVDIMLGITSTGTIQQVVDGEMTMNEIIVRSSQGIDVIPGGSGFHELSAISPMQQRMLLDEMELLGADYDLVLIDTAAGIGDNVLYFVSSAESALVVLTPDPTSLTDAYALIKVLSQQRDVRRFSVIINQAADIDAQITFRRLLSVADRYLDVHLDFVGSLAYHPDVRKAIQAQQLLYAQASKSMVDALNNVLDTVLAQPRVEFRGGGMQLFWQRSLSQELEAATDMEGS
ncbi:MAG: MinD/ParA family protein [Mariprofundaceae bacterium]